MAQISEEDIINGVITRQDSYLKRIISKAPVPADQAKYEQLKADTLTWQNSVFSKLYRNNDLFSGKIK